MNFYSFSGISNSWRRKNSGGSLIKLTQHYANLLGGGTSRGNFTSSIVLKSFFNRAIQTLVCSEMSILNTEAKLLSKIYSFDRGQPDVVFAHSQGCNIAAQLLISKGLNPLVVMFDPKMPLATYKKLATTCKIITFQSELDFLGNQMICNDRLIDKVVEGEHYFIKGLNHFNILSLSKHQQLQKVLPLVAYEKYSNDLASFRLKHSGRMNSAQLLEYKKFKNNHPLWITLDIETELVYLIHQYK